MDVYCQQMFGCKGNYLKTLLRSPCVLRSADGYLLPTGRISLAVLNMSGPECKQLIEVLTLALLAFSEGCCNTAQNTTQGTQGSFLKWQESGRLTTRLTRAGEMLHGGLFHHSPWIVLLQLALGKRHRLGQVRSGLSLSSLAQTAG